MIKWFKWLTIWAVWTSTISFAAVTGKIRGKVVDSSTQDPLPGVNVLITKVWDEGIEKEFSSLLGAATNLNGEFFILRVPPGEYSITAKMMGYTPLTINHVQVNVDRTSNVDFALSETVIEGQEIIVESRKELVQLDVSATESYISNEQYESTPFANRVEDVIGLESGIRGDLIKGDIRIREGAAYEVGFLMDGQDIGDRKNNRPVFSIQPGMVEEIKIMRNGFNAEYGQSRSGVINIVTKNPSEKLNLSVDYQVTPPQSPHYGRDKYDPDYRWEWRLLGSPDSFEPDSLLIPDGRHEKKYTFIGWNNYSELLLNDNNPDNDLTPEEAYELWKWRHRPVDYGHQTGHNLDVTLSGKTPLLPWKSTFLLGGKYEYNPFNYPMSRDHYDERIGNIKLVNQVMQDARLTLNVSYSEVRTVTSGSSTSTWSNEDLISYNGDGFPDYYPFYKPVVDRYATIAGAKWVHTVSSTLYYDVLASYFNVKWSMGRPQEAFAENGRTFHGRLYLDPQSGYIPKEKGALDAVSGYRMFGGASTWDNSYNNRFTIETNMTNQFHPAHELKTGVKFIYNTLVEDREFWKDEDPANAIVNFYQTYPIEFGAYVQDKIEFQGMIANVGFRFDYFDVNTIRPDYRVALDYASDRELIEAYAAGLYPTMRARAKTYISPRIGISHPLSARSKIYFNYGHFVSTPKSEYLYRVQSDWAKPRMTYFGNPDMGFTKTIAYELGGDMSLGNFTLHLGAFYKDNFDFEDNVSYAHSDQSLVYESFDLNYYKEIRGIEIEVRKNIGRFFTGWLNYNIIKKSQANLDVPPIADSHIVTDDPNIGKNGIVLGIPRSDVSVITPWARGVVTLSGPPDWGPKIGNFVVLGDAYISFQMFYQGGEQRRHPRQSFNDANPDIWFKELSKIWASVRLSKTLRWKNVSTEIYLDASNILHTTFRNPPGGLSGEDYYDDLWESGRINQVGTDELNDPTILRTENDDVYWGRVKNFVLGFRIYL